MANLYDIALCYTSEYAVCRPYDTMEEVIGLRGTPGHGSLKEWGVAYRELPLAAGGLIDWAALRTAIIPGPFPPAPPSPPTSQSLPGIHAWCCCQ